MRLYLLLYIISTVKKTQMQKQQGRDGNKKTGHIAEDDAGSEESRFVKVTNTIKTHCGSGGLIVTVTAIVIATLILITGLFGLLLSYRYATSPPLTTGQSSNNQSWDFGVTFGELKISSSIQNAGPFTIIFALVLSFFISGFISYLYFVGCEKPKIKQSYIVLYFYKTVWFYISFVKLSRL